MKTVNLYGVDGITVYLDPYGDIVEHIDDAVVQVIGRELYACSLEQAQQLILDAYNASQS